jgi:hypothetical protein
VCPGVVRGRFEPHLFSPVWYLRLARWKGEGTNWYLRVYTLLSIIIVSSTIAPPSIRSAWCSSAARPQTWAVYCFIWFDISDNWSVFTCCSRDLNIEQSARLSLWHRGSFELSLLLGTQKNHEEWPSSSVFPFSLHPNLVRTMPIIINFSLLCVAFIIFCSCSWSQYQPNDFICSVSKTALPLIWC